VVEMGLGPSSPSCRACEVGFGEFSEVFFTLFLVHWTLVLRASDASRASGEYAVLQPHWNQALDAPVLLHRMLKWYCSCIRWLRDVSSFFESSCALDAVASVDPSSDASDERKSSLVAY
jgi:hypothetical protein